LRGMEQPHRSAGYHRINRDERLGTYGSIISDVGIKRDRSNKLHHLDGCDRKTRMTERCLKSMMSTRRVMFGVSGISSNAVIRHEPRGLRRQAVRACVILRRVVGRRSVGCVLSVSCSDGCAEFCGLASLRCGWHSHGVVCCAASRAWFVSVCL